MKKVCAMLICLMAVSVIPCPSARAAELEEPGTRMRKLQRGFLNIALSPMDVFAELKKSKKEENIIPGWVGGLGRGSVFAVGRVLTGAFEMVTFFVPVPSNYEPIVQPEFAWQHFDDQAGL